MDTHPSLDASGALPPLPHISPDQTSSFLTIFTREVLDFFSFLSQSHLLQLVQRHHDLPASLGDDQIALLFAVYALGAFRLESFSRVQGAEGPTTIDPSSPRIDIAFYRHSLKLLEGATTVTALQALVVLQLYAMSTCSVAATRSLVGKIVYVVQELGLHRKVSLVYELSFLARGMLTLISHRQPPPPTHQKRDPPSSSSTPFLSTRITPASSASGLSYLRSTRSSSRPRATAGSLRPLWPASSCSRGTSSWLLTRERRISGARRLY